MSDLTLSKNLRNMIDAAHSLARSRGEWWVGVEHLLFVLLVEPECSAFRFLNRCSIDPRDVEAELSSQIPLAEVPRSRRTYTGALRKTDRYRAVFAKCYDIARSEESLEARTWHLLCALSLQRKSVPGRVLHRFGLTPRQLRDLMRHESTGEELQILKKEIGRESRR